MALVNNFHLIDDSASREEGLFSKLNFYKILESSNSIGAESGWSPKIIQNQKKNALLLSFEKSHSYGEYIFDWSWAQAYEHYHQNYYPKLTSMIPFTPVTTPHFLMNQWDENHAQKLLNEYENHYLKKAYSSSHFLFLPEHEKIFFEKNNYLIRHSIQYHFKNFDFESFEHFLSSLKSRKAKKIRKERNFNDIKIEQFYGESLRPEHAKRMYLFYLRTIQKKRALPYLTHHFFTQVFKDLSEHTLYVQASRSNGEPIAGSLYFFDKNKLYGRYWGNTDEIPNLHFEMCYYQGIDFCIKQKISLFEAGAQGEHKISRGFLPQVIYSAHKVKSELFRPPIKSFIEQEKKYVQQAKKELLKLSPFKSSLHL